MTRINSAIKPKNLTDSMLNAELRELPRIFTAVQKRHSENKPFNDIPTSFTLGIGHVKFFYNKCKFLTERHSELRKEYFNRFNQEYKFDIERTKVPNYLFNDYVPTLEENKLLVERISTRIMETKQKQKYYRKDIKKEDSIELLYK